MNSNQVRGSEQEVQQEVDREEHMSSEELGKASCINPYAQERKQGNLWGV